MEAIVSEKVTQFYTIPDRKEKNVVKYSLMKRCDLIIVLAYINI
jgi:hypothetical protein